MKPLYFIASVLTLAFSNGVFAQVANTTESTQIEASTGPVTVTSSQPTTLPNAADYEVKIADLDGNGDKRLSRREVPARHALTSEFHLVDRNHDGYITETELANWK